MTSCRNVTLPDGTIVRVQGDRPLTDEQLHQLQEIMTDVRARWENECHALSAVLMPEIARRHGRETYWCSRELGHDGPHRWPADTTRPAIAEWT